MSAVRVVLYVADPEDGPGSVEAAYHAVSRALAGTPGLVGNSLLRAVDDPRSFAVLSEWSGLDAFRSWEDGADHRGVTASLRPFQAVGRAEAFRVYEVAASY
ncbi:antibiotic biosynthesis monooxygenase family protein [Actinomadura sp. 9N407]|uniref:antibiotic biosynthesis monooxygenase family protein n=1 Tax=Actinomadura sp. 9N407 TaxID=3375154 RepID=UPI0037AF6731